MQVGYMHCCGVREIDGLSEVSSPANAFLGVREECTYGGDYQYFYNYVTNRQERGRYIEKQIKVPAFFIFTQAGVGEDVNLYGYGDRFKAFIEAEKLGTVTESEPNMNTNSGNLVKVFVWQVDGEAFKNWKESNGS